MHNTIIGETQMRQNDKKISRDVLTAAILQVLILLAAVLFWLLNRGHAYQRAFTLDELLVADNAIVVQDVTMDESVGGEGVFLTTPALTLEKGIYQVQINYNASWTGSRVSAHTAELSTLEFHSPAVELNPAYHTQTLTVEIARDVTDLVIEAYFSGGGYVSITGLGIAETSDRYKKSLFYAFVMCLIVNLILIFKRSDVGMRKVIFALSAIFLATCYPLYNDYITVGHDVPFHLLRIEGIAEGLRTGSGFPVKIHPFWAKGYGYAVGVMYGDIFLYFPALLRLLGFSIQSAYKIFVAAMNLGTVVIAYLSFGRMFQSRRIGVLGSLIYSLSLYRLMDTYTRAAVGEYLAMMFFPLVLCGFYLIFTETSKENWKKYAVLTAFGLTGLIQNHVLSCEMAAVVILLACLILIRRVFQRYVFRSLVLGALLTVLLNVGFLVPFLEFYGGEYYINADMWVGSTVGFFQENGIFPIQLFSLFQHSNGGAWNTVAGVSNEVTTGVGIIFLLGIVLFGYLALCHYQECRRVKNFQAAGICLIFGGLFLYMSTSLFPWDAIADWGEPVRRLVYILEFPWRLLAPATALLTFVTCFTISALPRVMGREVYLTIGTMALVLLAVNSGWYLYDFAYFGEPYRVYYGYEMNTMQMYSYDYLPVATDPEEIKDGMILMKNIALFEDYRKQGTNISCKVTTEEEGYVDFPLLSYPHYICIAETGEQLPVTSGYNGMLRVTFPAGFDGNIQISYKEPWFWRLSEILSLFTLLGCSVVLLSDHFMNGGKRTAEADVLEFEKVG